MIATSHSPTLITIYASISQLMMKSHLERRGRILQLEGIESYLIDHHKLILDALVARDRTRTDELLEKHFEIGADFGRRATLRDVAPRSTDAKW